MTIKAYRVVLREYDKSFNDGYIIVKFQNKKIKSLEGIFTCDYLTSIISEEYISIIYYALSENGKVLEPKCMVSINLEDFRFPINMNIKLESSIVEVSTQGIIKDKELIVHYQEQIQYLKATAVFM